MYLLVHPAVFECYFSCCWCCCPKCINLMQKKEDFAWGGFTIYFLSVWERGKTDNAKEKPKRNLVWKMIDRVNKRGPMRKKLYLYYFRICKKMRYNGTQNSGAYVNNVRSLTGYEATLLHLKIVESSSWQEPTCYKRGINPCGEIKIGKEWLTSWQTGMLTLLKDLFPAYRVGSPTDLFTNMELQNPLSTIFKTT